MQCNADTTLIPIRWAARYVQLIMTCVTISFQLTKIDAVCNSVPGPVSKDWGKHQCVAWEPIVNFMASRAFDPLQPGLLVHPTFGTLVISIVAATAHKRSNFLFILRKPLCKR